MLGKEQYAASETGSETLSETPDYSSWYAGNLKIEAKSRSSPIPYPANASAAWIKSIITSLLLARDGEDGEKLKKEEKGSESLKQQPASTGYE